MEIRTAGVIVLLHWILTTSRLAEDAVDIDVLKDLLNPFLVLLCNTCVGVDFMWFLVWNIKVGARLNRRTNFRVHDKKRHLNLFTSVYHV